MFGFLSGLFSMVLNFAWRPAASLSGRVCRPLPPPGRGACCGACARPAGRELSSVPPGDAPPRL